MCVYVWQDDESEDGYSGGESLDDDVWDEEDRVEFCEINVTAAGRLGSTIRASRANEV